MKLSVARVFEVSQIAASKAYGELQPFIEYVNQLADNVIRVLQNGVGLKDNLDAELQTIALTHGSSISVAFRKKPIAIIAGAYSGTQLNPLVSLHAVAGAKAEQAMLTAYFTTAADSSGAKTKLDVQVIAFFS